MVPFHPYRRMLLNCVSEVEQCYKTYHVPYAGLAASSTRLENLFMLVDKDSPEVVDCDILHEITGI